MVDLEKYVKEELCRIFKEKSFSCDVKKKIEEILLSVSKADFDEKLEQIHSILFGLKNVEQFYIDSRVNLSSYDDIKGVFSSNFISGVVISKKIVAVLLDSYLEEVLYHELLHLTQRDDSYFVPQDYYFSNLIQLSMQEGEVVYYDIEFAKYKFPQYLKFACNDSLVFSNHSIFYLVCREFYLDMKSLLSKDLLICWKNNSFSDEDFIEKARSYVLDHYSIDFLDIYQIWSVLLYYFSVHNDSFFSLIADNDFNFMKSLSTSLFDYYDSLIHYHNKILEHNFQMLDLMGKDCNIEMIISLRKSCEEQNKKISFISKQKNFLEILLSINDISYATIRRFAYIKEVLLKKAFNESSIINFNDIKPSFFYTFADEEIVEDEICDKIYSLYF